MRQEDWKILAEIVAREHNTKPTAFAIDYAKAIQIIDKSLWNTFVKNFEFVGGSYPILLHIGEKYKFYTIEKALSLGKTISEARTESSVQEFKQSF